MKIAITGGNGFIGRKLVTSHLALGDKVTVLTRRKPNIRNDRISYVEADLTDITSDLSSFVADVDILYHCAGEIRDESLMHSLHVNGTRRLINAAVGNIGRWVQLSSVGVYGKQRNGIIDELSSEEPVGEYEITKKQSDDIVIEIANKYGMDYSILRPSTVFGSDMPNMSLYNMVDMIRRGLFFFVGSNEAQMNYIHISDVVNALMLCGIKKEAVGEIFNLSQTITLKLMTKALSDGIGVKCPTFTLPEKLIRFLAFFMNLVPMSPLSTSRVDALTGMSVYDAIKIQDILGVEFDTSLSQDFEHYSHSLKTD